MGRVVLFKGESSYNALNIFIDCLADAFRRLSYHPVVVDFRTPDKVNQEVEHAWSHPCDFAFGFNGIGGHLTTDGKSVYDALDTLYISHMVDHPIYHLSFYHETQIANKLFLFADRQHIEFITHFFPELNTGVLIQAGSAPIAESQSFDDWNKRDIDLLFVGTVHDFNQIRKKWLDYPAPLSTLFDETAHRILTHQALPIEKAFGEVLEERGYYPSKNLLYRFTAYFQEIDIYVRSYKRFHCLKALAESGFNIKCFTNAPDILMPFNTHNCTIHPSVPMTDIFPLMGRSRIVLNTIPGYIDGAHERIFSSMLCGAVSLSDSTLYLRQRFTHGQDILFYDFQELDRMHQDLSKIMSVPETLFSIALSGQKKSAMNHTWKNRAQTIIDFAKTTRLLGRYEQNIPF